MFLLLGPNLLKATYLTCCTLALKTTWLMQKTNYELHLSRTFQMFLLLFLILVLHVHLSLRWGCFSSFERFVCRFLGTLGVRRGRFHSSTATLLKLRQHKKSALDLKFNDAISA